MLDQLDEEFGIGNLLKEEIHISRNLAYTEKDLKGLTVEHDIVSNHFIMITVLLNTLLSEIKNKI